MKRAINYSLIALRPSQKLTDFYNTVRTFIIVNPCLASVLRTGSFWVYSERVVRDQVFARRMSNGVPPCAKT